MKKKKSNANLQGTSPKYVRNQGNHTNVLYTVFDELSDDSYFFNRQIQGFNYFDNIANNLWKK